MTREEAIVELKRHMQEFAHDHGWSGSVLDALDVAIEALQTQLKESPEIFNKDSETKSMLNADLISRQSESCEDTISRSELLKAIDTYDKFGYWGNALIPLVSEDGIKLVPYIHYDDVVKCIKSMPPVPPQKVIRCKDCKYVWKEDGYDNLWCNRLTGSFSVDRDGYCAWAKMEEGD